MNNHILVHSHNIYALTVPSKLQQQVFDICQEKHNTWFIDFLTTRSEEENKAYQARLKRVWNCFGNRIHGYNKRIAKQEKYFRFVNHISFHKIKGVSTRSPSPIFDSIGGKKTAKEVIRAYKKFGPKRTNRLKAMLKNSKKYFGYGF